MVDMAAISGLVASLRAATDISKAMIGLRDAAMIQGKVIELPGVILSAQQSALSAQSDQFTALERIRELEKEVADFEAWEAEKQKYELKEVSGGAFAFMLKPDARGTEPAHWLCTNCFESHKKSIFQGMPHVARDLLFRCPKCDNKFTTHGATPSWENRAI